MGVEPFLVSSSLEGVLAQRLVRTNCRWCREEYEPENPQFLPPDFHYQRGEILQRGRGCKECRGTGFSGRKALYELLMLTDELRELILNEASASQLLRTAREQGLVLMRDEGWRLCREGETTPEEVLRVTKI
jgi:type II secretory ATPase GspE/PulE/Tfp pilus assembly ATPase PilB-like protein